MGLIQWKHLTQLGQGNRTQTGPGPYMGPKDHIWDSTQLGQRNWTQRPYGIQPQKMIGLNTVGRKTRPKDHIWAKTIYGIQHSGTGKSDPKKTIGFNIVGRKTRPRDHIWAKTIYGIQHSGTGKSDPNDDRIQHSWQENQTQRPYMGKADHIWAKRTIYGQRPYMGFNTVGQENQTQKDVRIQHSWQENQTQIPYMGKDHIWDSTQWDRKIRPKR